VIFFTLKTLAGKGFSKKSPGRLMRAVLQSRAGCYTPSEG
jgi:hypothetical protein